MICCDTSFLFSFYHYDTHSAAAHKFVAEHSDSLSLSPFNRFELYNAFRFSEFCKVLQKGRSELLIAAFEKDFANGYFQEPACNLATILTEAHYLSSCYTLEKGYRTFDIIHIATAVHLHAKIFLTFDQKQRTLAKSQGFEIPL